MLDNIQEVLKDCQELVHCVCKRDIVIVNRLFFSTQFFAVTGDCPSNYNFSLLCVGKSHCKL